MFTGLASPVHLIILLVIVLLLFGAKRLPELGRSLGQGIQEFKAGTNLEEVPEEERPSEAVVAEKEKEQEKQPPKAVEGTGKHQERQSPQDVEREARVESKL